MRQLDAETGYWWLPESPNRRYPGRLSFEATDGATLELSIEENVADDMPSFTMRSQGYPLIHGETDKGRRISILKCYSMKSRSPLLKTSPISSHTVFGHMVLDGFHLPPVQGGN